jgi:hypothetical protein
MFRKITILATATTVSATTFLKARDGEVVVPGEYIVRLAEVIRRNKLKLVVYNDNYNKIR